MRLFALLLAVSVGVVAAIVNYDPILFSTPESHWATWMAVEAEKRTLGRRLPR